MDRIEVKSCDAPAAVGQGRTVILEKGLVAPECGDFEIR
jgi:hypothetical protein